MSAKNGDRSRYNRLRKQKLLKRELRAALIKKTAAAALAGAPAAASATA